MKKENNIYDIVKNKDEKKLKEEVIDILKKVIKKPHIKNEISYWESYMITIPMELGWKDNWVVKDKVLDEALAVIANFEGDTEIEAIIKSKELLKKLKYK